MKGKVIKGHKKANGIGFPTANIKNIDNIGTGIYAGRVKLRTKMYDAVLYVGEKRKDILEAHLFGYKGDLYGKEIEIKVLDRIRDDKEVENDPLLIREMIEKDCLDAKALLDSKNT